MGLLDYLKTPEGQGLLSGVAGYAATARRGTPWNNAGRGLASGLAGYAGALDRIDKDDNRAFINLYKTEQMNTMLENRRIKAAKFARDQADETEAQGRANFLLKQAGFDPGNIEAGFGQPTVMNAVFNPDEGAPTMRASAGNPSLRMSGGLSSAPFQGMPQQQAQTDFNVPSEANQTQGQAPQQTSLDKVMSGMGWPAADQEYFREMVRMDPKGASKYLTDSMKAHQLAALKGRREVTDKVPTDIAKFRAVRAMNPEERAAFNAFQNQESSRKKPLVDMRGMSIGDKAVQKDLGSMVGNRAEASLSLAEGAVETMNYANSVRSALNKGLVIAGPMAGVRIKWAQLKNLGGAGNAAELEDTRTTIQGLAELTLDSRASLKGQGQITEGETKLLERARSGNIEDMTVDELQTVVDIAQRLASRQYAKHQILLGVMKDDPNAAASYRYYVPTSELPSAVGRNKGNVSTQNAAPASAAPAKQPPKFGDVQGGYRYQGGDPANPKSWVKK